MPKQWKLITLYMIIVYLIFVASIHVAKHQVLEDEANKLTSLQKPL
jgi:hypothetical protein